MYIAVKYDIVFSAIVAHDQKHHLFVLLFEKMLE